MRLPAQQWFLMHTCRPCRPAKRRCAVGPAYARAYAVAMTGWRQLLLLLAESGTGTVRDQVVASSPGLLDDPRVQRHLKALSSAAGVCSEPAYGWVDDEDLRFVFCRTPVTPATLAVHLLVAPRAVAGAAQVLGLYDSPSWWRGEPLTGAAPDRVAELPEISLRQFERPLTPLLTQPPPPEEVISVVLAILDNAGNRPVLLYGGPDAAVATIAAVTQTLPALSDLVGFSTWEAGAAGERFDLLGRSGREADGSTPGTGNGVLQANAVSAANPASPETALLDEIDDMLTAALPDVVALDGTMDRVSRDQFFNAMAALVHRPDRIPPSVDHPRCRPLLLAAASGRQLAARSLWTLPHPTWSDGHESSPRWSGELRELGTLSWRNRPPAATSAAIATVHGRVATLGEAAEEGFVQAFTDAALGAGLAGADPPASLLVAAFRAALDARLAPSAMRPLLQLAAEHVGSDLLTSAAVPVVWRVRVATTAWAAGSLSREVLSAACARDPQLAQQLISEDSDHEVTEIVLGALHAQEAAALVAAGISTLGAARAMQSLREIGRALGSAQTLHVMAAVCSVIDLPLSCEDEQWVADHFAAAVGDGAHDVSSPDPVADLPWDLAGSLRCDVTWSWQQSAAVLGSRRHRTGADLVAAFELLLDRVDDARDRHAVATVGAVAGVITADTADAVGEVMDRLAARAGMTAAERTSLLLTCAERVQGAPERTPLAAILVHIARTSTRRRRLKRRAVLRDDYQLRAQALARRLSQQEWVQVLRTVDGEEQASAQWLRGLVPRASA